jgi:hypothetical protein
VTGAAALPSVDVGCATNEVARPARSASRAAKRLCEEDVALGLVLDRWSRVLEGERALERLDRVDRSADADVRPPQAEQRGPFP